MTGVVSHAVLLVGVVLLTGQMCGCTADAGRGDGFSVELIHRDHSVKSPFHDPSLTPHGRMLAAVRRSTGRAAALARSYAATAGTGSPDGGVAEVISIPPFDFLMYVNIGLPPTRMLVYADTGSDLLWVKCGNDGTTDLPKAAGGAPPRVVFNPSKSSTFGRVNCKSGTCHAFTGTGVSCDAKSNCKYVYSYGDGSETSGVLSTETLTFDDAPGGCVGCPGRPQLQVANFNFGCSTSTKGAFTGDGLVGFGDGKFSLANQLGAATSIGRRFSYCLVPSFVNTPSILNFGARAAVTEPGAVTTPLLHPDVDAYLTIALESVRIGDRSFTLPQRARIIVDSGTTLTLLVKELLDPMVEELTRSIKLRRVKSPDEDLPICYDVSGVGETAFGKIVPEVKLGLGGGGVVTLKAENTFVMLREGTMCMALMEAHKEDGGMIWGNIAQQNMHIGIDLDKRTATFASVDCATSYPWPTPPSASL
ncbi:aspartic proteinase CDR1-like [Aegilops tauschii subsp. strangulata]|uniref:Aspartic proteinase nepenthesin-2 n=1 Tax=Aegilops tauschii TaxID=37682 RepID=N1R230_AEGTA|nr:aspartic proteinase CDR1-like [Aegilops tauschii subsp. strangulata]